MGSTVRPFDRSTGQLEADIRTFIDRHNDNPKPFKWTKSADEILASVKRFCQKTDQTLCSELWIHVTRAKLVWIAVAPLRITVEVNTFFNQTIRQ